MDCDKSLELLSEYQAEGLAETESLTIRIHLEICNGCLDVFRDLDLIVKAAATIGEADGIAYPDENALWVRLQIGQKIIH